MMKPEEQLERDLAALKTALSPSPTQIRRLFEAVRVTKQAANRYQVQEKPVPGRSVLQTMFHYLNIMSLKLKILIPAAVVILLIAVVANRRDGGLPTTSPLGSASSSATTDEIINAMINDSISEQSILDEANGDTQYVNYDSAQVEAFTSVYNANEY